MGVMSFFNRLCLDDRIYDQTDPSDEEHFDIKKAEDQKKIALYLMSEPNPSIETNKINMWDNSFELIVFPKPKSQSIKIPDNQWSQIENGRFDDMYSSELW